MNNELYNYIKVSNSPNGCDSYNAIQFKCDRYLDCESCLEDKIKEHDNQIKAEFIEEVNKKLDELERNCESCYGAKIVEMYADTYEMFRKWLDEQKCDNKK